MQTKIGCVKSFAVTCAHKCNFLHINATFVENKCNFLTFLLQQKLALVMTLLITLREWLRMEINSVALLLYHLFFYFYIKTSLRTNTLLICGDVIFKALLIPACLGHWTSLTWCSVSINLWHSFSIMGGVISQSSNHSSSGICGRILKRLENSASSNSLPLRQKRGTWFNKCTNKLLRVQKSAFHIFHYLAIILITQLL